MFEASEVSMVTVFGRDPRSPWKEPVVFFHGSVTDFCGNYNCNFNKEEMQEFAKKHGYTISLEILIR